MSQVNPTVKVSFGDPRLPAKFWNNAYPIENGCWIWAATISPKGYGYIHWNGVNYRAHRLPWIFLVSRISEGLHLDHLCRERSCVNPAHLEPVTPRENIMRGEGFASKLARSTSCKSGHPFDASNTIFEMSAGATRRQCRACAKIRDRAYRARLNGSLP
jgi:hypothetical protein